MCCGFVGKMDDLVKENRRKDWPELKRKYFVLDENDAFDLRMPGKWKEEFSTTNGGICMYVL